jgi:cyclopropane-fatty-acyl-phospholipid synthase
MDQAKLAIEKLLNEADIQINGDRPSDIKIHDNRFYHAVIRGGTLAFGESYMAGWWDADKLDELATKIFLKDLGGKVSLTPANIILGVEATLRNLGRKSKAFEVGEKHYDIGNDLYERMLDKRMAYTCAYWSGGAKNLDAAQEAKFDLVCRKLNLKPGQKILDTGCGWGSFAKFAAQKYGVSVLGVTVSKEQVKLGKELCKGLPVEIRLQDYRDVEGIFDHVVSIGLLEHVGYKNYRTYLRMVHDHLKDDGLFLLHFIATPTSTNHVEPWTHKYIFPNGHLPSIAQVSSAAEKLFVIEDIHNFGSDYDKTLMAWFKNFDLTWPEISAKYGDTFYRMWKFYLLFCAGSFRARTNQLYQIVLSKQGVTGGYRSVR